MAFGGEIRNEKGEVILDNTDRLTRLVYSHVTDYDETDSVTLDEVGGKEVFWVCEGIGFYPHVLSRSGNTFSWSPSRTGSLSQILIFVYT